MRSITIRSPDDFHVHLRRGSLLSSVAPFTEQYFSRALVMPNTSPAIMEAEQVIRYQEEIRLVAPRLQTLMTIKLTMRTTKATIAAAKLVGVVAAKLYPEGVTTNSQDGVSSIESLYPIFEAMQEVGMVLCLHGELPEMFVMDREWAFLETLQAISMTFPRLKIVLEHITTSDAVKMVLQLPDTVAATITVHHMKLTLDDVVGGLLKPHNFCKPIPKRHVDKNVLIGAATSGNPKFFLGTDSAPHLIENKECASGCAGVFTAPVALQCLAEIFDNEESLEFLEAFTSEFGAQFYGLPLNEGTITLRRDERWVVSTQYGGVVPFLAGETLQWWVSQSVIR